MRDFLDAALVADSEHVADALAAACLFEQVVNIWSPGQSDNGRSIGAQLRDHPAELIPAIDHNLQQPHTQQIDFSGGSYIRQGDAKPEVRLGGIVGVAEHTRSTAALKIAQDYVITLRNYWRTAIPDFPAAISILRALDKAQWRQLAQSSLHDEVKDDHLRVVRIADFDPRREACNVRLGWSSLPLVPSVLPFRHNPFQVQLADMFVERDSAPVDVLRAQDATAWAHGPV